MKDEGAVGEGVSGKGKGLPAVSPSIPSPVPDTSSFILHPSSFPLWLERATVACLFLYAVAAPHSIAVTQTAWLLAMLFWVLRLSVRPRPALFRTPVDKWL